MKTNEHIIRYLRHRARRRKARHPWTLCQYAQQHGYEGEIPYLYFVEKVSHGDRLDLV